MHVTAIIEGLPGPPLTGDKLKQHADHQIAMLAELDKEWRGTGQVGRQFRACFRLPTGSGKTRVATHWAVGRWAANPKLAILWLAHRKELLQQAAEAFDEALRSVQVGAFGPIRISALASRDSLPKLKVKWQAGGRPVREVAICSVAACRYSETLDHLLDWANSHDELLVIIDEAHHAVASTYVSLLEDLGVLPTKTVPTRRGRHLLGLSATPTRTDREEQRPLEQLFGDRIFRGTDIDELVKRKFLAKPHVIPMQAEVSLKEVVDTVAEERYRLRWHDLHPTSRRKLASLLNRVAVDEYGKLTRQGHRGHRPFGKAIAFCVDTNHADELTELFLDAGHRAAAVHSKSAARKKTLERFELAETDPNRLDVLTTVDLLTEGVDLPCTEIVIMLRPTLSRILFQQMVGRCLRGPTILPGKTDAYILDLALNEAGFPNWMSAWELLEEGPPPNKRRKRTTSPPEAVKEPVEEDEFEADVALWFADLVDVSVVGRVLAGWYEIPHSDDEDRHDLLAVYDDDRRRYQQWASDLLKVPHAPAPDGLPDDYSFRRAVRTLDTEPPFHAVGESKSLEFRVAEMAANSIVFGKSGLLRDRLRDAVVDMRRRFGLAGDGGADTWRAALRALDRRTTDDFIKALQQ